jgi:serine/threonine protein kinase
MSEKIFNYTSEKLLHNRYEIQRQLGQNGGRQTLLALDSQTKKQVVIKILAFDNDFRWEDLKLFEREAETLKSLSHPAIPRYIDYFEIDIPDLQGFALVQTYIKAQSLQEHLLEGRNFNEIEIKQLAKSLLEVLDYLHSRKPAVIHRDIKPSNILLSNRSAHSAGDLYLVDFGSVQTSFKEGGTRTIVGTYGYMPPEQFGGRAFPASDLYSLGATLIYLATKKHPAELIQNDLQIEFEPIKHLSLEFTAWLKVMTQASINRRFNSVAAAMEELENPLEINLMHSDKLAINDSELLGAKSFKNSNIIIKKYAEKLEILFPMRGVNFRKPLIPAYIVIGLMLSLYTYMFASLIWFMTMAFSQSFIYIYVLLFIISFIIHNSLTFLTRLFGKTRIIIDGKYMSIAKELFGNQSLSFAGKVKFRKQDICKIISTAKYYQMTNSRKEEELIEISPNIIIWVGTTQYDLNKFLNKKLTENERDWIVKELSNWLNIPITED